MKLLLQKVIDRNNLTIDEAKFCMGLMSEGSVPVEQMAALLAALRVKGETPGEVAGFVNAMLEKAVPIQLDSSGMVDTCGTGGDASGSFNISTTVAFVVAGGGIPVAKHGNRSVSSKSGSADVLEELGVATDLSVEKSINCLKQTGFAFLFAPLFHPAMKFIGPVRKAMGVRTVFNVLGPLLNPAKVKKQVIGVFSKELLPIVSGALLELGHEDAMVVSSADGLDEFSISDVTHVAHLKNKKITYYDYTPEQAGLMRASKEELIGGDSKVNAEILLKILKGAKGACRSVVLLNAAAVFYVAGKVGSIKEGISHAEESIDSGKALKVLEAVRVFR